MTGSVRYDGERRYSRTDWTVETVCGREAIKPLDGEVAYGLNGEFVRTHDDGKRFAAFIRGDQRQLADHYGRLSIMELLDSCDEMQDAEDAGDVEKAALARDRIAQKGFTIEATAGRRGTKPSRPE